MKTKNPFKFGSIVEGEFFTNRTEEIRKIRNILSGENHLIIVSPRRYGKTSLVSNVISDLKQKHIMLDLQLITTPQDLAEQLLKRIFRVYPFERLRQFAKRFKIVPTISINPITNEADISFGNVSSETAPLIDVLELIGKLGNSTNRLIVVLDEFQEISRIGEHLDRKMRAVMQYHKTVNYIFLGSQESFIRDMFEKKRSPFYHFGMMMPLSKIGYDDFLKFLTTRLSLVTENGEKIAVEIVDKMDCHPYYTQQLAYVVWNIIAFNNNENPVEAALEELLNAHDVDYERLWNTIITTDRKILLGMASFNGSPLSDEFGGKFNTRPVSTVYSGIKRLMIKGYVVKNEKGYEIDDPLFKRWILSRRER